MAWRAVCSFGKLSPPVSTISGALSWNHDLTARKLTAYYERQLDSDRGRSKAWPAVESGERIHETSLPTRCLGPRKCYVGGQPSPGLQRFRCRQAQTNLPIASNVKTTTIISTSAGEEPRATGRGGGPPITPPNSTRHISSVDRFGSEPLAKTRPRLASFPVLTLPSPRSARVRI